MTDRSTAPMDTPNGRVEAPAAPHRLHGADRSGLGERGWAEVPADLIGDPDDTNVPPDFYEPMGLETGDADEIQPSPRPDGAPSA